MAADSSQSKIRMVEENSFNSPPTSPTMVELRYTSESIAHTNEATSSNEVRDDRMSSDTIRTNVSASGDISFEFSHGAFDNGTNAIDLIGGAMANSWNSALSISGSIDVDATNTQFTTDSSAAGGADFSSVATGQWILTANFSTSANNDYWRVNNVDTSTSTNHKVVVDDPNGNLTDETGSGDETMSGTVIFNGTTFRSYTLEKEFTDISVFTRFGGLVVGSWSLDVSSNSQITGTFGMQGKKGETDVTSSLASSTTSAATGQVFNTIDHVAMIRENQSATTLDTDSISFTLENGPRPLDTLGNLGPVDMGLSRINLTGSFNVFFTSRTLLDRMLKFTDTALSFKLEDGNSNAYIIDIPSMNITNGSPLVEGADSFVLANLQWTAKRSTTTDSMISVTKF